MSVDKINTWLQTDPMAIGHDGWLPFADLITANLWVRTGDHQFTVTYVDPLSSYFRKYSKIRYKDGGSYEYGVIKAVASVLSGGNYITTVDLIPNTDYALHASNTITDRYISYIENPDGFPAYFNFDPQSTNISGGTEIAHWTVAVGMMHAEIIELGATFAGGNVDFTLPVTPVMSASVTRMPIGIVQCLNSAVDQFPGVMNATPSSAVVHPRAINISPATWPTLDRITSAIPFAWGASDELNCVMDFHF